MESAGSNSCNSKWECWFFFLYTKPSVAYIGGEGGCLIFLKAFVLPPSQPVLCHTAPNLRTCSLWHWMWKYSEGGGWERATVMKGKRKHNSTAPVHHTEACSSLGGGVFLVIKQLPSETGCWKVRYRLTVLQRAVLPWLPFVPFHIKVLVTNITSNNILQEQSLFPSLGMENSFLQDFLTTVITIRAFPSDCSISAWLLNITLKNSQTGKL